ncbi:YihY/virulence factor BrkB family protein [Oscillatoria sp. FACHB-1407]|nr:YihY/virulence factor BrkB family protein [Oscillatoria sp. FACHB-1407]MBD2465645.1 YihY/virulence factor BrkB family protein [Oscillatoria sp. FACHB-1407]
MLSTSFARFFAHLTPKTIWRVVESAGQQRLPGLAAEMAYNAMLALFPAILTIITAIGLFKPLTITFERLASQLSEVAPLEALALIQDFANEISRSSNRGLFSLSFVVALWASSGALSAAMTALDQIHQVPPADRRPFWKAKLISLGLTIGTILLLMLASTLIFVSDLAVRRIANHSDLLKPGVLTVWRLLAWPLALGIVSVAFAFVYRFGPSRWIPGKPILPGAMLAAVSWAIVSSLFRLYVSNFGDYNRVYGAVGAVIVLLLWLYLSSLILLIGDQLNVTVCESMQQRLQPRITPIKTPQFLKRKR